MLHGFVLTGSERSFLGKGVYFYEGSKLYAQMWARQKFRSQKISVIEALLSLGKCLDLNTAEGSAFVEEFINEFKRSSKKKVSSGAIIALICQKTTVETIRGTDVKKGYGKLFDDDRTGFYKKSPLIICVKDLANILNYDICYEGY